MIAHSNSLNQFSQRRFRWMYGKSFDLFHLTQLATAQVHLQLRVRIVVVSTNSVLSINNTRYGNILGNDLTNNPPVCHVRGCRARLIPSFSARRNILRGVVI